MRKLILAISLTVICHVCLNAQDKQPVVTKGFYLTDDNNKMYYESYGSGEIAIVFIHGWSVNCRSWDDQIDYFKDKNKVILIDLPGFGKSEHNRQDWTMQHYGKDVAGLCKELHLNNVYLVGWSLGTGVVVETARLLGNDAKAVVLVDQLHKTDYVFDSLSVENWFNKQVSKYKNFNAWYKSYHSDSALATKYLSMMPSDARLPDWWKPGIISFFKWQENSLKESVSALKVPIRAINASNMLTNEEQWKSFCKDYKLTVFENSTHMLVWEYPQKFNETLLRIIGADSLSGKYRDMVKIELFGMLQGKEVYLLTLTNKAGNVIRLNNFGARITWIEVPDFDGKKDNITFGYDTFESTIKGDKSFGSVLGRFAGGISKGKFSLDGLEYTLSRFSGWTSVVWNTEILTEREFPAVRFSYVSPDMEGGFPGTINAEVIYTWTNKDEIIIDYNCSTDRKTVMNITNHAYFNLHGAGNGDILDHEMVIKASAFTPVDSMDLPTGEIRPVTGTPFDFTTPHTIGERIGEKYEQLDIAGGYDHNFVLDNKEVVDISVYDPVSGRLLEVITDQPGVVFYTGNYLDGTKHIGYDGKPYNYRSGFCLETGHFPDSPNHPHFPTTEINPGETFKSKTIYRFTVK